MGDWIGSRWLADEFQAHPVQPFPTTTRIGASRRTQESGAGTIETVTEAARPKTGVAGHLSYAIKHEGVHLEFLARLFDRLEPREFAVWLEQRPTGQYARRASFLYEWLTGREVDFDQAGGNYVDAATGIALAAREPENVAKWRVRNNLPGVPSYCPTVRATDAVERASRYDLPGALAQIEADFGAAIIQRTAIWLTVRESRASFRIEHEEQLRDRVQRFANAIGVYTGAEGGPLGPAFLDALQRAILGASAVRLGLRRSPVFIGETGFWGEIVHYVGPDGDLAATALDGLREVDRRTKGTSAIVRAAAVSFGFAYIHPLADGNGRVSRFLVNDVLRRDGAVPQPFILPISATITGSTRLRAQYDAVLEVLSKPFMARYREACHFGAERLCEDGIRTNLDFRASDDARYVWAYPDLTAHATYLGEIIPETVEVDMRNEARLLQERDAAVQRVKEVLEAPDVEIDRMIRSIRENAFTISGKLRREYPILEDARLAEALIEAVRG
ncbi:MAG TPA: Fic family protein [Fimbriimonadaceae bacterium]|nr:Fic family protein [Fimbriimonadaceae bacterium]